MVMSTTSNTRELSSRDSANQRTAWRVLWLRPRLSHGLILTALVAVWRWHVRRRIERELSWLGDEQLKDIGITRGEISRVARRCVGAMDCEG